MTIVLGQLVLHGLRFTTPNLQVEMSSGLDLPQLWPLAGPIMWPSGGPLDDEAFLGFTSGKDFHAIEDEIGLSPWRPASELRRSQLVGGMIELPTICGKHVVYYPAVLVERARRGRLYAFGTACECPVAYLIYTEPDGAHCKVAGEPAEIEAQYEALPGEEDTIEDEHGVFPCKLLPRFINHPPPG